MATRLLAPALALGAVLADGAGLHGLALWLVLLALPVAAAIACVGLSDALAGRGWLLGSTATLAVLLLVLGSTVRESAVQGAAVPTLAITAVVGALVLYAVPALAWLLEPLRPRPRARTQRRTVTAHADSL
jgi:hypothetical protein